MTFWIIEPHDPLIVRDGKPFGPNPGARASSLAFPFPSTTTGGVRTRAGLKAGVFDANSITIEKVKKIKVKGPLLVQLQPGINTGGIEEWLVPAPLDALLLDDENIKETVRKQLVPLKREEGMYTDLKELSLVGLQKHDPRKPSKNAPKYWYWKEFERWLLTPPQSDGGVIIPEELGHEGPQREYRTHVSVDAEGLVAKEGALFQTSGLEFTFASDKEESLRTAKRLALAMIVENNDKELTIQEGLGSFGGERRTVSWRKCESNFLTKLLTCPELINKEIIGQKEKACRLILLTPAFFEDGYYPRWLLEENKRTGVNLALKAIAIQRPQVVSGWDLAKPGPKPSRRLAPAGTVLFLELKGSDAAVGDWISKTWMQCISDSQEDRNDGFGLAVLGTWTGQLETMQ